MQPLPRGVVAAAHGGHGPQHGRPVPGAAGGQLLQGGRRRRGAHPGHNRRRPGDVPAVQVRVGARPPCCMASRAGAPGLAMRAPGGVGQCRPSSPVPCLGGERQGVPVQMPSDCAGAGSLPACCSTALIAPACGVRRWLSQCCILGEMEPESCLDCCLPPVCSSSPSICSLQSVPVGYRGRAPWMLRWGFVSRALMSTLQRLAGSAPKEACNWKLLMQAASGKRRRGAVAGAGTWWSRRGRPGWRTSSTAAT